jgi:hypothetical protein
MANAYDYSGDGDSGAPPQPSLAPAPPQLPQIFSALGAPLARIAGLVNQASNGQPQTQTQTQTQAQTQPGIDPYTGQPVYSGPLNVTPGSAPPPGYVNANGRLKPVPKGYDWSRPQSLDPTNARWPVVGRADMPQAQQPPTAPATPPRPPEPYIPSLSNRPHTQWGEPDFAWRGAMNYPGVAPGPFMPQANDFPALIHGIVMGLGRWGSAYSGMPAIAMGTYATAFLNAYNKGMKERAAQNWQQYLHARQMTADRTKEELEAYREVFAEYGPDESGKIRNLDEFRQALRSVANKYHDDKVLNAIAVGDLGMVERLLQARDAKWNDLGKLGLQADKVKAEIERTEAQTDLARARIRALEKGGQMIPPDYEDPDQTDGEETQPGSGDRSTNDDETSADGDRAAPTEGDQDGDATGAGASAGPRSVQDQGTIGLAAARQREAAVRQREAAASGAPAGDVSGVNAGGGAPAPAARPPAGTAVPTTTGQALGAGAAPGAPPARPGAAYGAGPGAGGGGDPSAAGAGGGIGAPGTLPPPTGAPGDGQGAPPRGVPLALPPPHFIPPGMTRSQLDFESQRYYESGKDIYPAKQIAENTAIHRRASQINTFVNRLLDHYRPGIDSEQQLLDNIGRAEPNLAGAIRDILAGGEPLPRAGSGASEYNRLISQLPARIRPGFSGQIYAARQKIANDYSPGGYMGRMIFAENRLAPAALEVVRTARALPPDQFKFERQIEAYLKGQLGDPEYSNFSWRAYVSELVRIQRGGTGAEADIQEQIKNIAPSSSLRQILGGLRTDAKITIPEMDDAKRYWDSMNMGYGMPLYDQRAHDTLDAIMNRLDPETGNFFGQEPSGLRGEFIMVDPVTGSRRLYVGQGDPHTDRDPSHWIKPAERLPGQ